MKMFWLFMLFRYFLVLMADKKKDTVVDNSVVCSYERSQKANR